MIQDYILLARSLFEGYNILYELKYSYRITVLDIFWFKKLA